MAVLGLSLASTIATASQAPEQGAQQIVVDVSIGVAEETVSYIVTLRNTGSSDIANIYLAGSIPQGATTLDAVSTPLGGWFRGFEAPRTPLHAAVWLIDRIPANSTLGPFTYRVGKGQASDLGAFGWVRWLGPAEGSAISGVATLTPAQSIPAGAQAWSPASSSSVLTTALGGRFHEIHTSGQGLQCTTCHVQKVEAYDDPMAQVSNPVDKSVCLGCHASNRIFYGDDWWRSAVGR